MLATASFACDGELECGVLREANTTSRRWLRSCTCSRAKKYETEGSSPLCVRGTHLQVRHRNAPVFSRVVNAAHFFDLHLGLHSRGRHSDCVQGTQRGTSDCVDLCCRAEEITVVTAAVRGSRQEPQRAFNRPPPRQPPPPWTLDGPSIPRTRAQRSADRGAAPARTAALRRAVAQGGNAAQELRVANECERDSSFGACMYVCVCDGAAGGRRESGQPRWGGAVCLFFTRAFIRLSKPPCEAGTWDVGETTRTPDNAGARNAGMCHVCAGLFPRASGGGERQRSRVCKTKRRRCCSGAPTACCEVVLRIDIDRD